ncbi:ROK family protein [Allokutzneria sp. A3M-2-11 16]|uniref:ROK family protein n=1 Tax=Allokutzneria sp. A3M-2-11 16 TaxID=2962043 RepID=UPI0020B67579|nr:ROK family protein [Allokutzneria sp. A3M-2-11 16]MCP3804712.1 ROK family protein [Allokutzneria sp. A3M-2-11 16]
MGPPAQERARDSLGSLVLQLHTLGGVASRAELTERLGCGRSAMGYLLGELRSRGLVSIDPAGGRTSSADGGRPSHSVLVADDAPTVVAAQLGVDSVTVARVGLGGKVHARVERSLRTRDTTDALDTLSELITELTAPKVLGVGLAVPSPVRRTDGYAAAALHLGWRGVPLRELLLERLPLPLALGNDANLAAMAEYRHGAGKGATQLLYLMTGHVGLGGAVVSEGRLFLGARGYAMEPGHLTVDPAGAPCPCGSTGCLEVEADHRGLLRAAGRTDHALHDVPEAVEEVFKEAVAGDPRCGAALDQAARHLGNGLASLINLADADRIVLGGTLGRLYSLRSRLVDERVTGRSFLNDGGEIPVLPGALPDSVLLGAAELALQPLLDDPKRVLDGLAR